MEQPINNIKNTIGNIAENIPTPKQVGENITQGLSQGVNTVSNTLNAAKEGVAETLNKFSSPTETMTSSTDFLTSNSIIAKFVFVILVVIVFFFLANLSIKVIGYFNQPSKNPYVIYGLVNGNSNIIVSQNPQDPNSVTILRSNNAEKGLEASWSVWLNINHLNTHKRYARERYTHKKHTIDASNNSTTSNGTTSQNPSFSHIFNKGDSTFITDYTNKKNVGVSSVNNAPGLYISDSDNTLRVYMDTVTNNNNYLDVSNIPLKKWFHLAIRIQNTVMDVYINGVITARKVLNEVPKQNYNNVNVGCNGGFSGQLSNLSYYSHSLSIFEINNIILMGPNMKQSNSVITNTNYFSYLSNIWYSSKP